MRLENILPLLERVRYIGKDRATAQCPAHQDSTPSLSLRQAEDRVLIYCHAGCDLQQISDAVGLSKGLV